MDFWKRRDHRNNSGKGGGGKGRKGKRKKEDSGWGKKMGKWIQGKGTTEGIANHSPHTILLSSLHIYSKIFIFRQLNIYIHTLTIKCNITINLI